MLLSPYFTRSYRKITINPCKQRSYKLNAYRGNFFLDFFTRYVIMYITIKKQLSFLKTHFWCMIKYTPY